MISPRLLNLVRCPDCGGQLNGTAPVWVCDGCSRRVDGDRAYLALHPVSHYDEQTKYLDEALHSDARHEHVAPPLLSAKIRNDVLRAFLKPGAGDTLLDFGCGNGKALVWNADFGAHQVGIDVSPYFAEEAEAGVDLVLGDLRKLPFGPASFSKGWALDVFEHLSPEGLADVLREAARVMKPGGRLFAYSHVRKNAWIANWLKWVNSFARTLERWGLMDLSRERLRKSDHINPLPDVPALERAVTSAGFRIHTIRFYSPVVGAVVENLLMRMAEHWLSKRARARAAAAGSAIDSDAAAREARAVARQRLDRRGAAYAAARLATWAMKLDIVLFSRIQSGPFFLLLERVPPLESEAS